MSPAHGIATNSEEIMHTDTQPGTLGLSEPVDRRKRVLRHLIGLTAVAASLGVGISASTVNAAPAASPSSASSMPSTQAANLTNFNLPYYGSNALVPTYWGRGTNLCVMNGGGAYTYAQVTASIGGATEYISLPPYSQRCINRWWWGNPVHVINRGGTPLSVFSY